MYLTITDDNGSSLGELEADPDKVWLALLTYASERWEQAANEGTGAALALLLAARL